MADGPRTQEARRILHLNREFRLVGEVEECFSICDYAVNELRVDTCVPNVEKADFQERIAKV